MKKKKPSFKFKKNNDFSIKKDFYKRLFYIGICIIPIIIFADNKDQFRLVPLPFFLFGMYQLLQIIGISQFIIDDFFPPKTYFEKTTKPFDQFMYRFSSILFFVGLLSLLFEIRNFDNTINGIKLFWIGGFTGLLLALFLTIILKYTNPSVYFESKRRYTVHFGLFIGLFLFTASATGFINHYFADRAIFCKKYIIIRKGISGSRSKEYFINLKIDDAKEERFSIGKTRFDNFDEGEEIELCMVKGKFGFDLVKEFKKTNNQKTTY